MASPLLEFANAYLRFQLDGGVSVVDGYVTRTAGDAVIYQAFLKRELEYAFGVVQQVTAQTTNPLPGGDGQGIRYKGYVLRRGVVDPADEFPDVLPSRFTDVRGSLTEVRQGSTGQVLIGDELVEFCTVEALAGKFGGTGIDKTIYKEIGGVPISIIVGRLYGP